MFRDEVAPSSAHKGKTRIVDIYENLSELPTEILNNHCNGGIEHWKIKQWPRKMHQNSPLKNEKALEV